MNLKTSILLFSNSGPTGPPNILTGIITETPKIKDIARKRLVKRNLDIDSENAEQQSDNAAFTGKKYRVQDTHYGHLISEHDDEASAEKAATGRPFSRVISETEWQHTQLARDLARRKLEAGGPGSGRHKETLKDLGYKLQKHAQEGKVKADLYYHPLSSRFVLVHKSGAWSSSKNNIIDRGTNMKEYFNHYHPGKVGGKVKQTPASKFVDSLLVKR